MTNDDPRPAPSEDLEPDPQDADKVLEDLDAAEEEAADIEGGQRAHGARWHGRA